MALSQHAHNVYALTSRMAANMTMAKARLAHKLYERRLLGSKRKSHSSEIRNILPRPRLSYMTLMRRAVRRARLGSRARVRVIFVTAGVTATTPMAHLLHTRRKVHQVLEVLDYQQLLHHTVALVRVFSGSSNVLILLIFDLQIEDSMGSPGPRTPYAPSRVIQSHQSQPPDLVLICIGFTDIIPCYLDF